MRDCWRIGSCTSRGTARLVSGPGANPMQTECSAALFGFACVEGAAEAIRQLNEARFMAIVVTNQPAVARGEYTPDVLRLFHNILVSRGVVSTRSAQS